MINLNKYPISLAVIMMFLWLGFPGNTRAQPATNDPCTKQQIEAGTRRALLVAVSKYNKGNTEPDHDWWDLHTKADVELLADVLIRRFKFKPEGIMILSDQEIRIPANSDAVDEWITIPAHQPTHSAIETAFKTFLIKPTNACDTIYFHFSGHGQRVPDDGTDELDGYDETLIPIDYVSQKDASKNIRDDEIGQWLDALDLKHPATVTISLDSCFSGDATRGDEVSRGTYWKGKVPPNIEARAKNNAEDNSMGDFLSRGDAARGGPNPAKNNYIFLSAASSRQTAKETTQEINGETTQTGIFSYSLARALEKAKETSTYRDIYESVNDFITARKPDQNPQIEGKQLDNIVLGYGAAPVKPFLTVKFVRGSPVLQAGKLQGMTRGSQFALHLPETKEHKENTELAMVEITKVMISTSELKIIKSNTTPEKVKGAARAFETLHSYEDILRVKVEAGVPNLDKVFKDLGVLSKAEAADAVWNIRIRPASNKDKTDKLVAANFRGIVIERKDDASIIGTVPQDAADLSEQVKKMLYAEAKRQTLKSLESTDASLPVSFRLVPVEVDFTEDENGKVTEFLGVLKDKPGGVVTGKNGLIEFKVGDWVQFEITNLGSSDIYVTILDLQSDGRISASFPDQNCTANQITAKSKPLRIECVARISRPLGLESFRAIATRTPTDFSPLVNEQQLANAAGRSEGLETELRARGTRGDGRVLNALDSPLGKILMAAQEGGKRSPTFAPQSWTVVTVNFLVKPKT